MPHQLDPQSGMGMSPPRCLICRAIFNPNEPYTSCDHISVEDLFKNPKVQTIYDIDMDEKPVGMGLSGERFDLKCPDCAKTFMQLRKSMHGLFYGCPSYPACKGTHGANADGAPKGIPGDLATRQARTAVHLVFDRIWNQPGSNLSRIQAYTWMAETMGILPTEAHIARFSIEMCGKLAILVREHFGVTNAWEAILDDSIGE